ncbi:Dolichyl-phosphate-mannose-protein mannosyltransferase [Giardia muris]|uniref:GPI mannosyltransferase 1 n=1 Tax=Giardia muris TaxID=5742 RepID=A0A4Z1SMD7_GIAMU|nr:Dolichyl-phosphate-mannose-protein mannosyltransferase [Giardia muris]|eukprot:TNJ26854.1 Dolichyl-phosphate-mannose-protein mannosyltransferase [Giardia muris]
MRARRETRPWHLLLAALLRACVIAVGEYVVVAEPPSPSMTDVDYVVMVEGACLAGQPSERLTYRYSPLLAVLLRPACHPRRRWFGKALYGGADVLVAAVSASFAPPERHRVLWLFNPFVIALSTRGSFDSLVQLVIAVMLRANEAGFFAAVAVLLGFATHLRLYPVVFAPFLALHALQRRGLRAAARLVLVALLAFLLCNGLAARLDAAFFDVALRYHVAGRVDHRHNLSALWPLQLQCSREGGASPACLPFAPVAQVIGLLCLFAHRLATLRYRCYTAALLRGDLAAAALTFVALNSVVTAQYYAWALYPASVVSQPLSAPLIGLLSLLHLLWLRLAYDVEFGAASGALLPAPSAPLCLLAAVAAVRLVRAPRT